MTDPGSLIEGHVLLDTLLANYATQLGGDHQAYRNHCYRVFNFCHALHGEAQALDRIAVALAFHDLGIWTHGTLDYLGPSRDLAEAYLREHGLDDWHEDVTAMIDWHHRMRSADDVGGRLAEHFRRADWIDVSLGLRRFGLPRSFVRQVRQHFPNAGFHRRLLVLGSRRFLRHPLSPLPMFRW